jgi:tetratricopeptide (TPR) repeat protein
VTQARGFFGRALRLDPSNVDALIGAAMGNVQVAVSYAVDDRGALLAEAEAMLTKALSQSPRNAWAHYLMGRVKVQTNGGAEAIAEYERALVLNPNLASAHAAIGFAKMANGHVEETETNELEALRVSPRDTDAYLWVMYIAQAKLYLGAVEEAVDKFRQSIEINRNYPTVHFYLAASLTELGRIDDARTEAQTGLALNPNFTIRRYQAGAQSDNPVFLKGRERVIEGMRKAGVPEGEKSTN